MSTPYASSRAGAWLGFAALMTAGASACSLVNAPDAVVEAAGGGAGLAGTSSLGGSGATGAGGAGSAGGATASGGQGGAGATGGATASSSTATGSGGASSSSSTTTGGGGTGGATTSSSTDTLVCKDDEANCGGACVDLDSSAVNCGACGLACTSGALGCLAGECLVATELALGREHGCARLSDGTVRCWGANGFGQLGVGKNTLIASSPITVPGLSDVVHVAAGGDHSCALTALGGVWCWGRNISGQLGNGSTANSLSPVAIDAFLKEDPDPVVQVALGQAHSCALKSSGELYCWGANASGQLGDGTAENRLVPTPIELSNPGKDVALGAYHTCVVDKLDKALCWGANADGQLGDGTFMNRATPDYVIGVGKELKSMFLGDSHTCGLAVNGAVWCWGAGQKGQLCNDAATKQSTPVLVSTPLGFEILALGGNTSGAIVSGGPVVFCGDNASGQCGADPGAFAQFDSAYLSSLPELKSLALGRSHACGIGEDDVVQCWGVGTSGQLGDGTQTGMTYDPVKVVW